MSALWQNIFRLRQNKTDEIDDILLKIPIFQDLRPRDLNIIKRILHTREYKSNENIFNEGDVGLGMYIIVKGKVRIVYSTDCQVLAELGEGDFFGELSLLDESPRSAAAIASSQCVLMCFFKPELLDLLERNPKLGNKLLFKLAWTIGERLKSTNEQLKTLGGSVRQDEINS
ncbi:MAG TPA: cyclic nucleotide-binding domain-containing protein [Thermodesulfovibrionales bacterium]|nr:cyclic nucleotide-binding domain-containing protein [Thermodesulfovibrionales bacterium]